MARLSCGLFYDNTAGFAWEEREKPRQISTRMFMHRPRIETETYRAGNSNANQSAAMLLDGFVELPVAVRPIVVICFQSPNSPLYGPELRSYLIALLTETTKTTISISHEAFSTSCRLPTHRQSSKVSLV
jgi:hypothetical protein